MLLSRWNPDSANGHLVTKLSENYAQLINALRIIND
jgi:hypothetical protein